ncbi:MAG: type II toxin-antitoxin system VapB family antitoxin [Rhizobiaceae bacterium]|nr:type II toxin-antitoxin system VapB family antitoxin [Rhizobiaceae bacterium]
MPLYVKDDEVGHLASRLAAIKQLTKTEAVRLALINEIDRSELGKDLSAQEKVEAIRSRLAAYPMTGLKADKAFIDSLYED